MPLPARKQSWTTGVQGFFFFLWRIFALWSQKKTHSVNYTGAFLGEKPTKVAIL